MSSVYALSALAGFVIVVACVSDNRLRNLRISPYLILIGVSLLIRLFLLNSAAGYDNDINTFKSWANTLGVGGIANFYGTAGYTDYPPGFMYVLYVIGSLQSRLNLGADAFTALIKLPGVISDCVITVVLYRLALKKLSPKAAFLAALAYALNPATILDSAVWGQVDSLLAALLLVSVNRLADKKYTSGFAFYALAVLVKPQAVIAMPVFIYAVAGGIIYAAKNERRRLVLGFLGSFAVALALFLALCLPFAGGLHLSRVFRAYTTALGAYPYASVNAYNLYAFLGANWKRSMESGFWGMYYHYWGFIFIILSVVFSWFALDRARGKKSGFFAAAGLLYTLTFMFSTEMHERYLIPALVFFLAAYIHKPDKRLALFYGGFSLTSFLNCADILNMLHNNNDTTLIANSMRYISFVNLVLTAVLVVSVILMYKKDPAVHEREEDNAPAPFFGRNGPAAPESTEAREGMEGKDYLLIAALTLVYAAVAFINLGDIHAPQTTWEPKENESAVIELLGGATATTFEYYNGARNDKNFRLETSADGVAWDGGDGGAGSASGSGGAANSQTGAKVYNADAVFRWKSETVNIAGPYVRITSLSDKLMIQEIGFRDADGNLIPIKAADGGIKLCDEQQWVPERSSYMNGTYFDEIYHPRTAYEFLHSLWPYEDTHPPLGKTIISAGIAMFGMTPFGWRFMGTLTGVLMIPLIYIFAKRIFGRTKWALFTAFIFTFDFMHFAQTRLATIDSFVTFFIMCMYLFMYEYTRINFYDSDGNRPHSAFKKSLVMLVCCGAAMGLAFAVKWEGVYGAAGLPILLFYTLHKRYKEYLAAKNRGGGDVSIEKANEEANEEAAYFERTKYFPRYICITAAVCAAAFIIVPAVVYGLSYIPFLRGRGISGLGDSVRGIIANQKYMFSYHRGVMQTHAYSSRWYEWPVMLRPIYYYSGTLANGLREGITCFGNPAVWWTGIAALIYAIRRQSRNFSGIILFLFVAYGSQYLPWIFIGRTTFIYHYFPSVPFVALLVTFFFKDFVAEKKPKLVWIYLAVVFALFALFYPMISGAPVPGGYADALRLLPGWVLS